MFCVAVALGVGWQSNRTPHPDPSHKSGAHAVAISPSKNGHLRRKIYFCISAPYVATRLRLLLSLRGFFFSFVILCASSSFPSFSSFVFFFSKLFLVVSVSHARHPRGNNIHWLISDFPMSARRIYPVHSFISAAGPRRFRVLPSPKFKTVATRWPASRHQKIPKKFFSVSQRNKKKGASGFIRITVPSQKFKFKKLAATLGDPKDEMKGWP